MAIKDTLRLPDRSRGSAGLAMAASLGFGQMSFLFLNGSGTTLLIASLLPVAGTQPVSWLGWLVAALPLGAVYFVGALLLVQWSAGSVEGYRVDAQILRQQLATLGTVGTQEVLGLAALLLLLLIFISQPWHGLEPAWLALLAVGALAAVGADRRMFQQIDYPYLLYFGAFQSIAVMIRSTGTDAAFVQMLGLSVTALPTSPYLVLSAFAVLSYLVALLPGFPAQPVLMIAALPLASRLGYHPLVFALVILLTSTPILIPRLSTLHWLFWNGTEQRTFTHRQAFEFALARAACMVLAVMASIPFWRWLGLLPRL